MRPPGRSKRDTNVIGGISEAMITARLLEHGYTVLVPFGGNQRCDLMIEDADDRIWRVQCKTAWVNEDGTVLKFDTANHNVTGKNRQMRDYRGQCDYFAVYCGELKKVYLIPVDQVGTTRAHLRLGLPKNHQVKHVRWAHEYEL